MQAIRFFDRVTVQGEPRITADGYLVADAKVARTGIQIYAGAEVGRPDLARVRVYRSEDAVFNADTMKSFAHRPVTNDHPTESVTSKNWREVSVGDTGGEVIRDGKFVRVPLCLMDEAAIKDYNAGKRELSMGYDAEIVFGDGVSPEGEQYDAIQQNLRMNHLALVGRARGGDELRIGDANREKNTMNLKTVIVDGLTVETTEPGAQAIAKLQGVIAQRDEAANVARTAHESALALKDAELAKRDAEIATLKAAQITDAQIDERARVRATLLDTAKRIAPEVVTDGKSNADIRKATVVAKLGADKVADKSEAYVDAMFDILAQDAAPAGSAADPTRAVAPAATRQNDGPSNVIRYQDANDNGQDAYEHRLANAWRDGGNATHANGAR